MPVVSNTDPSALFSGDFWTGFSQSPTPTPVIVTYSFPTSLPASDTSVPNFTAATDASFVPFSAAEQAQAIAALGEWAAASQIVFVQVAPGKGDINFSNVNFGTLSGSSSDVAGIGYNPFGNWNYYSKPYFTTDLTYAGDVFMNTQDQNADGSVSYATLLHEVGHAIGLKHPTLAIDDYATQVFEDNVLSADDPTLTIMSTLPDPAADPHLLPLDLAAAAAIYGAPGSGAAGTPTGPGEVVTATTGIVTGSNSVSSWSWNADTQTMTQTAATADDVIHGTSVNDIIHAGSGTDYLFGLNGTNTLYGGTSSTSVDYLYGGPDSDTLNGGAGINYLYAGAGTEVLNGGAGTNTFYDGGADGFGGGGLDTLNGRGANDIFFVSSANTRVSESNPGAVGTVYASVSFTLPQYVDSLILSGTGLTGTANDDPYVSVYGDATNASTLIAGSGADYMVGGSGNDTLVAGSGFDSMFGGGGANTFVIGSVADTNAYIGDFKPGTDKIDLSGIARGLGTPLNFIGAGPFTGQAGQVESFVAGGLTFVDIDTTGSGSPGLQVQIFDNGVALQAGDLILSNAACYCAGTRILTERGEVAVERLSIGDRVVTASGEARPVKWIGRRSYAGVFARGNRKILPVCLKAGSLADGSPRRDLWVSPNHALFIDGFLIPAEDLLNGRGIVQADAVDAVHYFHVELDSHDVILAEGAWAETFVDDDSRLLFHNAHDFQRLYPDDHGGPARFCAPRICEGFELEAIRERLAGRRTPATDAVTRGRPTTPARRLG